MAASYFHGPPARSVTYAACVMQVQASASKRFDRCSQPAIRFQLAKRWHTTIPEHIRDVRLSHRTQPPLARVVAESDRPTLACAQPADRSGRLSDRSCRVRVDVNGLSPTKAVRSDGCFDRCLARVLRRCLPRLPPDTAISDVPYESDARGRTAGQPRASVPFDGLMRKMIFHWRV
jgi:hypothetical protein